MKQFLFYIQFDLSEKTSIRILFTAVRAAATDTKNTQSVVYIKQKKSLTFKTIRKSVCETKINMKNIRNGILLAMMAYCPVGSAWEIFAHL